METPQIIDAETHFETSYVKLQYFPDGNFVLEQYNDFTEDDEIIHFKNKFLEMSEKFSVKGYIADMREFKGATPAMKEWMEDFWLPAYFEILVSKSILS